MNKVYCPWCGYLVDRGDSDRFYEPCCMRNHEYGPGCKERNKALATHAAKLSIDFLKEGHFPAVASRKAYELAVALLSAIEQAGAK